jgi:DNA-binding XRE family transcriptional regulator
VYYWRIKGQPRVPPSPSHLHFSCKSVHYKSGAEGIRTPDLRRANAAVGERQLSRCHLLTTLLMVANSVQLRYNYIQLCSKMVQFIYDRDEQKGAEVTTIGAEMPRIDKEKLRRLREERFLSHRELAKIAGVSPTTVLTLEQREDVEPHRRTIRKLAKALDIEPAELLGK